MHVTLPARPAEDVPRPTIETNADSELPHSWREWVIENKLRGVPDDVLTAAMVEKAIDPRAARNTLAWAQARPGRQTPRQRLEKLESLLTIRCSLTNLSPDSRFIERRSNLSRDEFLREYYARNRPVVLTGAIENSAALARWTPEYLADACGTASVEVMSGRDSDPRYELRSPVHKTTMLFADYVQRTQSVGQSNDCYLVANNGFFDRPEFQILRREIPEFPEIIDPTNSQQQVFFWFGPAGTVTPLHHDVMNVLVAQIQGRKEFTLISPEQTHWMYNDIGVYSEVVLEHADYAAFPLFKNVVSQRVVLDRGEVLFIPVGWWHHVTARSLSMTVSYTNFVFPNQYRWANPSGIE